VVDVGVADDGKVDVGSIDAGGQALLKVGLRIFDGEAEIRDEPSDFVLFEIFEEIHRAGDSVSGTEYVQTENRTTGTRQVFLLAFVHVFISPMNHYTLTALPSQGGNPAVRADSPRHGSHEKCLRKQKAKV